MRIARVFGLMLLAVGCGRNRLADSEEVAQAAGEALASYDEALQGGGIAFRMPSRLPKGLEGGVMDQLEDLVISRAWAGPCILETFDGCASGERTRSFNDCTFLGAATISGSVTLTFSDAASCRIANVDDSVTREANFTVTGPRGAKAQVSSAGGGQKVTRTATGFLYGVLGMQRTLTDAGGKKVVDISSKTLEDFVISGSTRSDRTIHSGKLELTHHLAKYTTVLSPEQVKWTGSCTCPVSGKLHGTVTGARASKSFTLELTGCGTGTLTTDDDSAEVTFERCASL